MTDKFVGCILSIKTKPGPTIQNIIGTVREIDLNPTSQALILDDAMSNGTVLNDGFVVMSHTIADLQVIGKASDFQEPTVQKSLSSSTTTNYSCSKKSLNFVKNDLNYSPTTDESNDDDDQGQEDEDKNGKVKNSDNDDIDDGSSSSSDNSEDNEGIDDNVGLVSQPRNAVLHSLQKPMSTTSSTIPIQIVALKKAASRKIAKPKPRKPSEPPTVPIFGDTTQVHHISLPQKIQIPMNKSYPSSSTLSFLTQRQDQETTQKLDKIGEDEKENILEKTFGLGNLLGGNNNTVPSSTSSSGEPSGNKLGALSCFLAQTPPKKHGITLTQPSLPPYSVLDPLANPKVMKILQKPISPKPQTQHGKKTQHPSDKETFNDLELDEILTEEFDFEGSNALFDKLPVQFPTIKPTSLPKPKGVNKNKDPKFTSHDTTHSSERVVPSTQIRNSTKSFYTDTGIVVPVVDLSTRSRILNLGHDVGLGHERMIESMARAVVQISLPLLGDACRLSPEREDSLRPWVLVLAGPHWQGAVGIASARLLSSLGVHTFVHSPKEEVGLCTKEEKLYGLSGEGISRRFEEIPSKPYDLIIHALDDHLSPSLSSTQDRYSPFLSSSSQSLFIDPPVVPSSCYKSVILSNTNQKPHRVILVTPILPLNYELESGLKLFIINLGLPLGIYLKENVSYKSFYGDKLVVQVFSGRK